MGGKEWVLKIMTFYTPQLFLLIFKGHSAQKFLEHDHLVQILSWKLCLFALAIFLNSAEEHDCLLNFFKILTLQGSDKLHVLIYMGVLSYWKCTESTWSMLWRACSPPSTGQLWLGFTVAKIIPLSFCLLAFMSRKYLRRRKKKQFDPQCLLHRVNHCYHWWCSYRVRLHCSKVHFMKQS